MTLITDLPRVYGFNHLLTGDMELYAHDGGLFVIYSHEKNQHLTIDPIGMTAEEIERSIILANKMLAVADPPPVNRHERRKSDVEKRAMN